MMKCCPKCNGRGKTTEYDGLRKFWCDYKCEMCNGTGEVLTEQEYIQTCNTEQLAEWIVRIVDCEFCPVKKPCKKQPCKKQIERWLKQPHIKE